MSRYIDADALDIVYEDGDMTCVRNLDAMPTVDAVPVVRCEKCKYLGDNDGYYFCNAIGIAFGNKPNWFCADGERRTDEQ